MDAWADPDFILDEREALGERPRRNSGVPHPGRGPRVYDSLLVYGERLAILGVTADRVAVSDSAGFRIERAITRLVWDREQGAWRG
jgi:hypothetical protein